MKTSISSLGKHDHNVCLPFGNSNLERFDTSRDSHRDSHYRWRSRSLIELDLLFDPLLEPFTVFYSVQHCVWPNKFTDFGVCDNHALIFRLLRESFSWEQLSASGAQFDSHGSFWGSRSSESHKGRLQTLSDSFKLAKSLNLRHSSCFHIQKLFDDLSDTLSGGPDDRDTLKAEVQWLELSWVHFHSQTTLSKALQFKAFQPSDLSGMILLQSNALYLFFPKQVNGR